MFEINMEYISIAVSIMALSLSAFTFYWVQLRVKNKLHLVRIDKIAEFKEPLFALVNSGTKDILITSVLGHFIDKDELGGTYPAQRVEIGEGASMLLKAGSAVECKISFLEDFTNAFIKQGKLIESTLPEIYEYVFEIEVSWVDSKAQSHSGKAQIAKYGFSENMGARMFSPLQAKHDLYKKTGKV